MLNLVHSNKSHPINSEWLSSEEINALFEKLVALNLTKGVRLRDARRTLGDRPLYRVIDICICVSPQCSATARRALHR